MLGRWELHGSVAEARIQHLDVIDRALLKTVHEVVAHLLHVRVARIGRHLYVVAIQHSIREALREVVNALFADAEDGHASFAHGGCVGLAVQALCSQLGDVVVEGAGKSAI